MSTSGSSASNISGVRSSSGSGDKNRREPSTDLAAAGSFGSLSGGSRMALVAEDESSGVPHSASWTLQLASLLCNCVYECNLPVSALPVCS
jgi:hypothetical protein